ncbi:hypothetical protein F5878DRAFT_646942 [Lentinula raphanica]|uniref:Uncharacterized protein n=1 Tax=Lentinula raphanica TaxID=153919 RepID=A0AA38U4J5_9AGAR|nr:hypothetical protein F5878DRAFT_646942 [Lentinula raphanica]
MSMFTSRGLSILFLALCLLDVTATHKPDRVHDGSMIVRPDSELDICGIVLGEKRRRGEHTILLRFEGYRDFSYGTRNVRTKLSWTHIGEAVFEKPTAAQDLELAAQYADKKARLYPKVKFYEQDVWRYPNNILMNLHFRALVDFQTMSIWQRKLLELMTRTLTKGQKIQLVACYNSHGKNKFNPAEEAYLWIGDLLISPYDEQLVPSTGLVNVIPRAQHCEPFLIGEIHKDIRERWEDAEARWGKVDAQWKAMSTTPGKVKDFVYSLRYWKSGDGFIYALWAFEAIADGDVHHWSTELCPRFVNALVRHTNAKMNDCVKRLEQKPQKLLQNPTRSWGFKHRKFKICFSSCQPGPKEIAKIGPKSTLIRARFGRSFRGPALFIFNCRAKWLPDYTVLHDTFARLYCQCPQQNPYLLLVLYMYRRIKITDNSNVCHCLQSPAMLLEAEPS